MAIRLIDAYPNRAGAANSSYPHGSIVNESAPEAGDGTPLDKQWGNDFAGFLQGLLETAGITPNGTPDTAPSSQHLDALLDVTRGLTEVDVAGDTNVTLQTYDRRMAMVRLTGELTGDIDVIVPDTARHYVFINATSGSFAVTVKTSGGTGIVVPQGRNEWIYSDGVNVVHTLNMYARVDPPNAADGGTDAYAATLPTSPVEGETRTVNFGSVNTTDTPTLAINGGSAISLVDVAGSAWVGMIEAREHRLHYDGTNYVVLDPGGFVRGLDGTETWHEANLQSVGANSYATVFDLSGARELVCGALYGPNTGFRLTRDGTVIAHETAEARANTEGGTSDDRFAVISLPTAKANSSLKLEIYNISGGSKTYAWRVATR